MQLNIKVTRLEYSVFVLFLVLELVFNFTTQFGLYGAQTLFSHYAVLYMGAFVYNVYLFLFHTSRLIYNKGTITVLLPVIVLFSYMAFYSKDTIEIIWHYVSYLLFFINLYGVSLNTNYREHIKKAIGFFWYFGVVYYCLMRSTIGSSVTITGPTYLLLILFPLFYNSKKSSFYTKLILLVVVLVLSGKRGPVLAFIVAYVLSYLINSVFNKGSRSNIFKLVFTLGATAFLFFSVLTVTGSGLSERFAGIRDDGGSGRDVISEAVWYSYLTSSTHEKIWGHGVSAVINDNVYNEISAHNDFLEVLYDYGAVCAVVLLLMLIGVLNHGLSAVKHSSPEAVALLFFFFCTLFICLISHLFIYPHNYFEFLVVYALLFASNSQWKVIQVERYL